jgi:hypothetical protein
MSKKWRRFEVMRPRRFNDGQEVPGEWLSLAVLEIGAHFGSVSYETLKGIGNIPARARGRACQRMSHRPARILRAYPSTFPPRTPSFEQCVHAMKEIHFCFESEQPPRLLARPVARRWT